MSLKTRIETLATRIAAEFKALRASKLDASAINVTLVNNMTGSLSLPYTKDIVIYGDENTFYPVQIIWGNQDAIRTIKISRSYHEQAPWDPIGTGAHHGGLMLTWQGNFGGWGGATYFDRLEEFTESYTNMLGDLGISTHYMGYVFYLRGGGTTGAIYHFASTQPLDGYNSNGPLIGYNTSIKFYDNANPDYIVYAPATIPLGSQNAVRIDGLLRKKQADLQSTFDARYLPLAGKAADSNLIDGIDSSRIVYGDGGGKSSSLSDMNGLGNQPSGFYFYDQPNGKPVADWIHWISCMGNSWMGANYGFQIAHRFHGEGFYVRRVTNGSYSAWRTIWDSDSFNPALKANLDSPAFTGQPTVWTPSQSDNSTRIASTEFVKAAMAALVASSPAALDTLNELATALGNDPNFATTITNALAGKLSTNGGTLNGLLTVLGRIYSQASGQDGGNWQTASLFTQSFDGGNTGIAFHISGIKGSMLHMNADTKLYWENQLIWHNGNFNPTGKLDATKVAIEGLLTGIITTHDHYKLKGTYISGGTELPNYFGADNLKLQMLQVSGIGWSDCLWLSSYAGGDVKLSNQVVFGKENNFLGFRQQNYDSGAWGSLLKIWHEGNDGEGSGLNADLLDGKHLSSIVDFASGSDFADGTLVRTSIPASASEGASFIIEISGKSYNGSNPPFKVIAQGYFYGGSIIAYSGISYGGEFATYIKMFEDEGYLCFWWPRISYWNSFNVLVREASVSYANTVLSISNSNEVTGSKKVQVNLQKVWNTGNFDPATKVNTQYNTSLNSDSRNSRGVTRLYRGDDDSDYSLQFNQWNGSTWRLFGYVGDAEHGGVRVQLADNAGNADTLDGKHASEFSVSCYSASQNGHGFSVGDCIKMSGNTWVKVIADSIANAGVTALVFSVTDANNFKYITTGVLPGAYTAGVDYYSSTTLAGTLMTLSTPEVWTTGQVRQYIGTGVAGGLLIDIDAGDVITTSAFNDIYVTGMSFNNANRVLTLTRSASMPDLSIAIPFPEEEMGYEFRDITKGVAQTYVLDMKVSWPYTIKSIVCESDGTLTGVSVKINTTAVTGLGSLSVGSKAETNATAANVTAAGDVVTINTATSYSGNPTTMRLKIKYQRT